MATMIPINGKDSYSVKKGSAVARNTEALERFISSKTPNKAISKDALKSARQALAALSKTANQRLRDIEKRKETSSSSAYQWVKGKEYGGSPYFKRDATGQIAFVTDFRKMSVEELKKQAVRVHNFITAGSSTNTGMKKLMEKSLERFNESQGTKFTAEQYGEMWRSASIKSWVDQLGSEIINLIYTYMKETGASYDDTERIILTEQARLKAEGEKLDIRSAREALKASNTSTNVPDEWMEIDDDWEL